jgi:hypothetical protein
MSKFKEGDRVRVNATYANGDPRRTAWTGCEGTILIPSEFSYNVVVVDTPPEICVSGYRFWESELDLVPATEEKKP